MSTSTPKRSSMPCTNLLLSIPPPHSQQLRRQTDELLSKIVKTNYNTQFAQTASQLGEFRNATAGHVDGMGNDVLSESFRKTVPLTTYDSYASLMTRFLEKPCKANNITDLFAPGLPDYICRSSSTSGSTPKIFPKYNRLSKIRSSDARSQKILAGMQKRTTASIAYLWCDSIHIEDEHKHHVSTMYLAPVSVVHRRTPLNLNPEEDKERMETFILDHAAPYAAGFIRKWRSFLLIHALFAVGSRSLEVVSMSFISTFVDMMRYLDTDFDVVVECIANGTIPDLDGLAGVRRYLEMNILPDPERAAELRNLGRPSFRPGWCGYVWPNLHSVIAIASGSFAFYVPLALWFLGPRANIRPFCYACTEAWIAWPHSPFELNQFKVTTDELIEFLDVEKPDLITTLAQLWELELGKRYEIVLTTHDGLWRYRLGDVVEVCGFDPIDGVAIVQFSGRRNMAIRLPGAVTFNEEDLISAMSSMAENMTMKVVGWTATVDTRYAHYTVGFFVELAGDQIEASDLALATKHVADRLSPSKRTIAQVLPTGTICKPTIWLVRSGTFCDFRQLKLDEGDIKNVGQVKVPIVLTNTEYVTWFSDRVVQEL